MGGARVADMAATGGPLRCLPNGDTVLVVDTRATEKKEHWGRRRVLAGHHSCIRSVCASADGRTLVSCAGDQKLRVWDTANGTTRAVVDAHGPGSLVVDVSADGATAVSGSQDATVRVWNTKSATCRAVLRGHDDWVVAVRLSADAGTIASGSFDCTVRVWDTASGACRATLRGHVERVQSVDISADGRTILSGSSDEVLRVWDVASRTCTSTISHHARNVLCVSLARDATLAVTGAPDGSIRVWNLESKACKWTLHGHSDHVKSVCLSSDAATMASGSCDGTVCIWNVASGACCATLKGHTLAVTSVCMRADGKAVFSGSDDGTVHVWAAEYGALRALLCGHCGRVNAARISADGRVVASGADDATVRIWDATSGACRATLCGHNSCVTCVVISSDARRVVSGSRDTTVRVWDTAKGACVSVLLGHTDVILSVRLLSDERCVVSTAMDQTVRVWSAAGGASPWIFGHDGAADQWPQYVCIADFLLELADHRAVAGVTLERLTCDHSILSAATIARLSYMLSLCQSIKQVSLRGCGIDNGMMAALAERLVDHQSVALLDVRGNRITTLPAICGLLPSRCVIDIDWSAIDNVPGPVLQRGWPHVRDYLRSAVYRSGMVLQLVRVALIGHVNAGKTTLARALSVANWNRVHFEREPQQPTIGVDVSTHHLSLSDPATGAPFEFSLWDFGGRATFHDLHRLYLSPNAIFLIVWDLRRPAETSGVDYWLRAVRSAAGDGAPVMIVATHRDDGRFQSSPAAAQLQWRALARCCAQAAHLPMLEVCAAHHDGGSVLARRNDGVAGVKEHLIAAALSLTDVHRIVSAGDLSLRDWLKRHGESTDPPVATWDDMGAVRGALDLVGDAQLRRALELWRGQGVVLYFGGSLVITRPQWLADLLGVLLAPASIERYGLSACGIVPHAAFARLPSFSGGSGVGGSAPNPWARLPCGSAPFQATLRALHDLRLTRTVGAGDRELVFALLPYGLPSRRQWTHRPATGQSARRLCMPSSVAHELFAALQYWLTEHFTEYRLWRTDGYAVDAATQVRIRLEIDACRGGVIVTVQGSAAFASVDRYADILARLVADRSGPKSVSGIDHLCPHCIWYGYADAAVVPPAVVALPPEHWSWQCGDRPLTHAEFTQGCFVTIPSSPVIRPDAWWLLLPRPLLLPDEPEIGTICDAARWLTRCTWRLHLLCELPDAAHVPARAKGHAVREPIVLLRRYGKYMMGALQAVLAAAGVTEDDASKQPLMASSEALIAPLGPNPVLRYEELLRECETYAAPEASFDQQPDPKQPAWVQYQICADAVDPWCGLQPVPCADGRDDWMCAEHRAMHGLRDGAAGTAES